jgi:type VI secretion system protein ImpH
METEGRRTDASLEETLFEEAFRFEFFQAVRLLERIQKERASVGQHNTPPHREVVRFRTRPSLQFPASEIYDLTRGADSRNAESAEGDGSQPVMTVNFMGLIGPTGVLPNHTTELVAERVRYKDTALWEFLDLFNHRIVSFFYRAWERYRFTVAFERGTGDVFTTILFNLVGLGTRGLREKLDFPEKGLLLYSGLIAQRPHSSAAVQAILGDYFGVQARVTPFTGQWLKLDEESLCRLGQANSELGESTIAGARIWDVQSKFRLSFGPLTLDEFRAFLPSGPNFKTSLQLLRLLVGSELDFDVQLVLKASEVPACQLGGAGEGSRLGWTTWLKTEPFDQDDSQVVFAVKS